MTDRTDPADQAADQAADRGYAEPSPIGAGDTPNVAGTDEQQPQLSAQPEQGMTGDETGQRPRTRSPIVSVDPADTAGRGADRDTAARRDQERSSPA